MKIICNSYNIASKNLVSTLMQCSIPVSLLPNDDYSFKITFFEQNFDNLLIHALGDNAIAEKLKLRYALQDKHSDIRSAVRDECFLCLYEEDSLYEVAHSTRGYSTKEWNKESSDNVREAMGEEKSMKNIINFIQNFEKESHKNHLKYKKSREESKTLPETFIFNKDSLDLGGLMMIQGQKYKDFLIHVKEYVELKSPYILNEDNFESVLEFEFKLSSVLKTLSSVDYTQWEVDKEESIEEAISTLKEVFLLFKFSEDYY